MRLNNKLALLGIATIYLLPFTPLHAESKAPPKLVLQITVDALRGDFLGRFDYLFEEGGFRYLTKNGTWYRNAQYQHANTETIVGHTSLATGAPPSTHGMIANAWFDKHEKRMVYNIEDANFNLLTQGGGVDKKSEIDHTQKTAKADGRSPNRIIPTTLSDEIALASNGKAKVFGVSVKDRGAVSMAGHAGKAFWFSKAKGEFVTSNYYYDEYPEWVQKFNEKKPAGAYANKQWNLMYPAERYQFADSDDQEFETALPGFGRTFPHAFGPADNKYFTTFLTLSPAGDRMTLDFTKLLIENEGIGKDDVTDYLSVSFSSNDYVGHIFSSSSLENEDNLAHLDRMLAELFSYVDKRIGLDKTLIVLSSDHGQPEAAGFMNHHHINNVSNFDIETVKKSDLLSQVQQQLDVEDKLIETYFQPYLYLNEGAIQKNKLSLEEVETTLAKALMKLPGVKAAIPSQKLINASLLKNEVINAVVNNFHPARSGNIYMVFEPNVFINDFDGLTVSSTHGSPWHYDRHVPVIFAGYDIKPTLVDDLVTPYSVAPTISHKLDIRAPTGAVSDLMTEVIE